ncbi:MAG TPA: hypothetical protein VGU46_00740 [Acidobacteriaceae bacterium]|nr:hypothetical protein [Acidobacteriaceae bacterium]
MRWNTDATCPKCKRSAALRLNRTGFFERKVLRLLGIYPWKCGACGSSFFWPRRTHRDSSHLLHAGTIDSARKL